nr:DUF6115 domain-containing protein [uncultured Acetatifactor sp.]
MDIMEIILLIAGGVIFTLSFFIPDKKGASADVLTEEDIRKMIDRELVAVRSHLDDAVEESVSDAMEKTERSLERISNEKIMAVNEYFDTVLTEIHKNHEEVMFLYDMLNNKHTSLKNTVMEVNRAAKEAEEAITALKRQVTETVDTDSDYRAESLQTAEYGKTSPETEDAEELTEETVVFSETDDSLEESGFVSNKEKIRELYRKGKPLADIARELELGVGEVKLVIDLYQNR